MKTGITPISWFYNSFLHAANKLDKNLPSRLETTLRLDSDYPVSALNLPPYTMISKLFNITNANHDDASKTLRR